MPISKKKVIESASDSSANRGNVLTATFLQIRRRLQVISTSILGNSTEAEDALSEAFLRLWKSPRPLENACQVEAILTTTVRNISIDEVRKRRSHPADTLDALPEGEGVMDDDTTEVEVEVQLRRIEKLISCHLSPQQQRILRMRDVHGLAFSVISEQLDMQETAVRMQLSRARKLLRELYRQQYSD
jgi:RNA polymerase sigma factor, sigma-70 family